MELDRMGVKTLDEAIAAAESFNDYSAQPKGKQPNFSKSEGDLKTFSDVDKMYS